MQIKKSILIVAAIALSPRVAASVEYPPAPTANPAVAQSEIGGFARHLNSTNLAILGGFGLAAFAAVEVDEPEEVVTTIDRMNVDLLVDAGDFYGSGTVAAGATLGLFATGAALGSPRLTAAAADMTKSLLITSAAVWALKLSVNARRPNGGRYSFPSGHAATAFAMAPVLSSHFGSKVGYASLGIASFTGLGRMEDKKHYLTDVLVGAAIGLVVGRSVVSHRATDLSIVPYPNGLSLSARF